MLTGHLATAYLVRARERRATLVPLLLAAMTPDLADLVLPQGDQCRTACVLYTHAVPAVFALAAFVGVLGWFVFHRRATAGWAAALVVVHVLCDLLTGFKPYWSGGPNLGLVLYDHEIVDFALEAALALIGWLALRRTADAPRWAVGAPALGVLLAAQLAFDWWHRSVRGLHFPW